MDYKIPKKLPYEFLKSIDIHHVTKVKISEFKGAVKLECHDNVREYLKDHDGEVQFGWSFSQLGNIVFKLTGHVVVKKQDGELLCVTPSEHDVSEIYFYPDSSVESLIVNNKLPAKVYPLVSHKDVSKFVWLENLQNKMRLEDNEFAVKYIMNEKFEHSGKLIECYNFYK